VRSCVTASGSHFRDGNPLSIPADFEVPLDTIVSPFAVDGHSQFPNFIADVANFGPSGRSCAEDTSFRSR